jgi:hypothetical protein
LVTPKPEVVATLAELKDSIKITAQKYGIDSRALAGCILTENSLNVTMAKPLKDWLVQVKIAKTGMLWKPMSIGLGQIHVESAAEVEDVAAKIEGRPPRSSEKIGEVLLTPEGAIAYTAAILRAAQDEYAKNGFDISKEPEILTTVFNLGKFKEKAAAAASEKREPRPNYFGFYVQKNMNLLEETIAYSEPAEVSNKTAQLPNKPASDTNLSKEVELVSFPPDCSQDVAGKASEYDRLASQRVSPDSRSASGRYKILSPGLDCEMKPWSLIETDSGKWGWISDANLKSATTESPQQVLSCKEDTECLDQLKNQMGPSFIEKNKNGLFEIKLASTTGTSSTFDFRTFSSSCLRYDWAAMNTGEKTNKVVTPDEIEKIIKQVEDKKLQIMSTIGIKKWTDKDNYFSDFFKWALPHTGSNYVIEHYANIATLLKADFANVKSINDYTHLLTLDNSIDIMKPTDKSEAKAALNKQLDKIKLTCGSMDKLPESKLKWDTIYSMATTKASQMDDYYIDQVVDACKGMAAWKKRRGIELKTKEETEGSVCLDCQIQIRAYGGSRKLSPALLDKFFKTEEDFDAPIAEVLESVENSMTRRGYSDPISCLYDPFATAKRVESLLQMPCVKAAFVPDPYLVSKLGETQSDKGRVFLLPFAEGDRFAVKIDSTCEMGAK